MLTTSNVSENVKQQELSLLLVQKFKMMQLPWKKVVCVCVCVCVLYRIKHTSMKQSQNCAPWYFLSGIENSCLLIGLQMDIYRALFITAKTWKQLRCLSGGQWLNKLWDIQKMKHYSSLKRNELSNHEKK